MAARLRTIFANADDRLVEQLEPVLLDGARDTRDPLHLLVAQRRITVLVKVDLVAAHVLRGITGDVGRAHNAGHVRAFGRHHDHANRAANARERVLPLEAILFDGIANGFSHLHRKILVATLEQDAELIAAQACQHVGRADVVLHELRDPQQQFVAGGMPEGVVDDVELVEIEVQQRMRLFIVLMRGLERRHQTVLELTAVDQAGNGIVRRLV